MLVITFIPNISENKQSNEMVCESDFFYQAFLAFHGVCYRPWPTPPSSTNGTKHKTVVRQECYQT